MTIDENFQTPPEVCEYMVSLLSKDSTEVFEPTPGLGNLAAAAESKGYKVDRAIDFFTHEKRKYDAIIMNPPFSERTTYLENAPDEVKKGMRVGYFILKECLSMSDHVIALMPWFTLIDSDLRRYDLMSFGIKSVTALPRKTFSYSRIQTVVIELKKGWSADPVFKTFKY